MAQQAFSYWIVFLVWWSAVVAAPGSVQALSDPGKDLERVGLSTKIGDRIDLKLRFSDSDGRSVSLSELTHEGRPTLLLPVYYECPRICGLLLRGVLKLLNELELQLGRDFSVVAVSFNSEEGVSLAKERADFYRAQYRNVEDAKAAWSFLVGEKEPVSKLMQQLGFHAIPDGQEFAHTPVVMLLTPNGAISQYFTDINFSAWDMKLALVEASQGRLGSVIDHALLFCFRFDPLKGRYSLVAWNVLRIGSIGCVIICAAIVFFYSRNRQVQ